MAGSIVRDVVLLNFVYFVVCFSNRKQRRIRGQRFFNVKSFIAYLVSLVVGCSVSFVLRYCVSEKISLCIKIIILFLVLISFLWLILKKKKDREVSESD